MQTIQRVTTGWLCLLAIVSFGFVTSDDKEKSSIDQTEEVELISVGVPIADSEVAVFKTTTASMSESSTCSSSSSCWVYQSSDHPFGSVCANACWVTPCCFTDCDDDPVLQDGT